MKWLRGDRNYVYKCHPEKPHCPATASEPWDPSRSLEGGSQYQLGFLQFQLFHTEKLEEINRPTHRSLMVLLSPPRTLGTVTFSVLTKVYLTCAVF